MEYPPLSATFTNIDQGACLKEIPVSFRAPGRRSVYCQTLKIYLPFSWQTNNAQRADGRSQAQVTQSRSSHTLSPFPTHLIPACVGETFCPCRAVTCLDSVKSETVPKPLTNICLRLVSLRRAPCKRVCCVLTKGHLCHPCLLPNHHLLLVSLFLSLPPS